jgi:hypothetical protein
VERGGLERGKGVEISLWGGSEGGVLGCEGRRWRGHLGEEEGNGPGA